MRVVPTISAGDGPVIQGWCPGALRPMQSGDGYVVRVRPRSGRISAAQMATIASLARAHGSGLIDFSSRANIQLRGVTEASHGPLIEGLRAAGLVDETIAQETTRNIIVTPFWQDGDGTVELAEELAGLLAEGPSLPAKFGFAVDTGARPVLTEVSADIRIERAEDGGLILRADGADRGIRVNGRDAAAQAVALARWFVASGGVTGGRGRMRALLAKGHALPDAFTCDTPPASPDLAEEAGPCAGAVEAGFLVGFAFGQATAEQLTALADLAPAFRITPWRMVLAEGLRQAPATDGLLTGPSPLARVFACTGAPGCPQALQPVRPLARALARHVPEGAVLHVSGCAKGCAHPGPAAFTLTATRDGFDLARNARAGSDPQSRSLDPARLSADPPALFGTP
ncbi:MAG: precorrin-3B synthase [Notoacmeibacter sp.]|nr:precorrin-3B synthase [Notoacmeibacter sp.]MCC0031979.1 precorrin-3B synthase [Brucellaceae bacterium]